MPNSKNRISIKKKNFLTIISCNQHSISLKKISKNALKVLYRLYKFGYDAYLVGGSIRDILLGKKPKDFDIATNATPKQIHKLFRNCRLVGRRFQIAHIIFKSEIIEVATFRANHSNQTLNKNKINTSSVITGPNGMLLRDNIFGSIEEDAQRRDFSVNSLYYNVIDFNIRDYTGGLKDLQKKTIRLIGDPETRYREDPIRMLRAIRFAAKFDMSINEETEKPIYRMAELLHNIPKTRLFDEIVKLLQTGYGETTYYLLCKYQLFHLLFPLISCHFTKLKNSYMEQMITKALNNIDRQLRNNIYVNPAFLFAAMLWYPLLKHIKNNNIKKNKLSHINIFSSAINNIINKQCHTLALPKSLTILMRDIWLLQILMVQHRNNQKLKLTKHPKFNVAYDFLVLRTEIENSNELKSLKKYWNNYHSSSNKNFQKNHCYYLKLKLCCILLVQLHFHFYIIN